MEKLANTLRRKQFINSVKKGKILLPNQCAQFGGMMGMGKKADELAAMADEQTPVNQYDAIDLWQMENRVGILLTMKDEPGCLAKALNILTQYNLNMTSIQSRPPKTVGQQKMINFNIDLEGSFKDDNVAAAMWRL